MKIGSLFSGIGGLDLGLERAGLGEVIFQVEADPFCRKILEKNWPDSMIYPDVVKFARRLYDCEVTGDEGEEEFYCPRCDEEFGECECVGSDQILDEAGWPEILCGGFPCQDISEIGKRAGIDGERSGLWSEFFRIICEMEPRIVVVENVPALLGRGMERVLGDLASIGYDTEWDCVRALDVGAPHLRERLFIVANSQRSRLEGHARNEKTAERRSLEDGPTPARGLSNGIESVDWWKSEPGMGRMAHGISQRVDRLRSLGNAVVPQVAEAIGKKILERFGNGGIG